MQGRTTEKDICRAIIDCVTKKLSSDFKNLVGLSTDGAPAICGKTIGAMALLQEHIGRKIIINHCIIHRQVLCRKVLKFDHVMLVVVSIINCLQTGKLKHCLFTYFLKKLIQNMVTWCITLMYDGLTVQMYYSGLLL